MKYSLYLFAAVVAVLVCGQSWAVEFNIKPGMTSGTGDIGMKHAAVSQVDTALNVHIEEPPADVAPATPVVMMSTFGVDYTPAKFDVLEDRFFNAQYGWNPSGYFSLPAGSSIWIERTGVTQPAGSTFKVYEAGMGTEMPVWTMNEIYSNNGFRWQWDDGLMQHDFYVADMLGSYSMSFNVYLGDSAGEPWPGYSSASATFEFLAVPEPATLLLLFVGGAALFGRRR